MSTFELLQLIIMLAQLDLTIYQVLKRQSE